VPLLVCCGATWCVGATLCCAVLCVVQVMVQMMMVTGVEALASGALRGAHRGASSLQVGLLREGVGRWVGGWVTCGQVMTCAAVWACCW